jgi:hypothetical protein
MKMNRVEMLKAQDLLVQLVQIFEPLAKKEAPSISFLNQRFFIPPNEDSPMLRLRHPVSLLKTTLDSAQEQIAEWIEQLPADKATEISEKPTAPKEAPAPKKGEAPQPTLSEKQKPPLSLQAQKLIVQVRDAIVTLCTSSNIVDPKAAPLREALIRIKPLIDEIIKAVSQEGMHSGDDEPNPHFRLPVPQTAREHLFKKHIPTPQIEPKAREEAPKPIRAEQIKRAPQQERKADETTPAPRPLPEQEAKPLVSPAKIPQGLEKIPIPQEQNPLPRALDRLILPGAPFHPETRALSPSRKKKKRKGFWFRDEDDKEKRS